jgi:PmbA protein
MLPLEQMREFAADAASSLARESDLADFEVYCSSSEQLVVRLNYTSDIPCRGVEEAKSENADGLALRVVTRRNPHECGWAFEAGELDQAALRRALERARANAIADPHFVGLPSSARASRDKIPHAPTVMMADGKLLVSAGWDALRSAIDRHNRYASGGASGGGFILGGDITVSKERIAVAGPHAPTGCVDQHAHYRVALTAFIEEIAAKASVSRLGTSTYDLRRAASSLGWRAVDSALRLKASHCPSAGEYRVLLGPQPVAEILNHIVLPSLTARSFYTANSAYLGRFGAPVMDRRLSLDDDPRARHGAVRRHLSCEGIPARRITLVRNGELVGLLASFYDARRLQAARNRKTKLSVQLAGSNGYRLADSGVRRFDAQIATSASNVVMRARHGRALRWLMRSLDNGIYIGNVWYTYPINGQAAGDFTCTISGGSYLIRNGVPEAPIAPNCLRINANIRDVFEALIATEDETHATTLWGAPQAYYVPSLAVERLSLSAITSPHEGG